MNLFTKVILSLAIICLWLGGCSYYNKKFGFEDDHPLEEMTEQLIENYSGIEIDLSPED